MTLAERVKQDTGQIVDGYKEIGVDAILKHVYELSFIYQVEWYFVDIEENLEPDDMAFFDILKDYKGNIPKDIFNNYLDYSDPEDFNFNSYKGIDDIVRYFVTQLNKGENKNE